MAARSISGQLLVRGREGAILGDSGAKCPA